MGQGLMRAIAATVETNLNEDDIRLLKAVPAKGDGKTDLETLALSAGQDPATAQETIMRLRKHKLLRQSQTDNGLKWSRSDLGDLIVTRATTAERTLNHG